jgi:hypothetical protein
MKKCRSFFFILQTLYEFWRKKLFSPKKWFGTANAIRNQNPSPLECMDVQEILCTKSKHTRIHGVSALFLSD